MRSLQPAVFRRFLLLGALIATVALVGCGGSGSATPGKEDSGSTAQSTSTTGPDDSTASGDGTATTRPAAGAKDGGKSPRPAAARSCQAQLGDLVHSLDRLRVRLATGLSYEEYAAAVRKTRAAYAALPADRLPADCLIVAGTAAEKSVNRYIEAANAWGECLADAGCDAGVVEPELQRAWQVASHWLSEAQAGLKRLA